ncbi:MAG: hypothetical protein R3B98_10170 [Hyphomonas sp.]
MDVFLYNGPMERGADLDFIEWVSSEQKSKDLLLLIVTNGGNPDAAYKIGRHLQNKYDNMSAFVPGLCKSAGTLIAIAANEIVFTPYGELGPLDIQLTKRDDLLSKESGLNIGEAFSTLESRARDTYNTLIQEILANSGGIVSFTTASHSAAEILGGLYGPIFARIDPEEVGSRARAMRIGEDYGARLDVKFSNLKNGALNFLSQKYPSHGFVIDFQESQLLFNRVREATEAEQILVQTVGKSCRMPQHTLKKTNLTATYAQIVGDMQKDGKAENEGTDATGSRDASAPARSARPAGKAKRPSSRKSAS